MFIEFYVRNQNANKSILLFNDRLNIKYIPSNIPSNVLGNNYVKLEENNDSLNDKRESLINQTSKVKISKSDLAAIQASGKKFVLYDNYLIDIDEFMHYHPGGFIHLDVSLYNDITRFVTGTVALNGKWKPFNHPYTAIKFLHTKIFAVLDENHQIINNNHGERYNI
jgi:hypothetical protein